MALVVNVTPVMMGTIVKMTSMNAVKIHAKIVGFAMMKSENIHVIVQEPAMME